MSSCPVCLGTIIATDSKTGTSWCLECDWREVLRGLSQVEDEPRCRAAVQGHYNAGARCRRPATTWDGMCQHHGRGTPLRQLLNQGLPPRAPYMDAETRIYFEAIAAALSDADLLTLDADRESATAAAKVRELKAKASRIRNTTAYCRADEVVYFCRREGLIKIGVSTNVPRRMAAISKGGQMPSGMTVGPVDLLATTPGGYQLESRLHAQFADARVDGEWFQPVPALLRLIDRYRRRTETAASA